MDSRSPFRGSFHCCSLVVLMLVQTLSKCEEKALRFRFDAVNNFTGKYITRHASNRFLFGLRKPILVAHCAGMFSQPAIWTFLIQFSCHGFRYKEKKNTHTSELWLYVYCFFILETGLPKSKIFCNVMYERSVSFSKRVREFRVEGHIFRKSKILLSGFKNTIAVFPKITQSRNVESSNQIFLDADIPSLNNRSFRYFIVIFYSYSLKSQLDIFI